MAKGHNVVSSLLKGRVDDHEETRGNPNESENSDRNISNWVPRNEISSLEEMENHDPFEGRSIGVRVKRVTSKKCPTCKLGFNAKSNPVKCHGCDSFTHKKKSCLEECHISKQFFCKICYTPRNSQPQRIQEEQRNKNQGIKKVATLFKCTKCNILVGTKYSANRHYERKHSSYEEPVPDKVSSQAPMSVENSFPSDYLNKDLHSNTIPQRILTIGKYWLRNILRNFQKRSNNFGNAF